MTKKETDPLIIINFALFGIVFLFASMIMPTTETIILLFSLGTGFSLFAVTLGLNIVRVTEKTFQKNKRAALWIWAVCLLSITVMALAWFVLTWPTYMIIEYIEPVYTFPPEATPAITLVKNVIAWFLILMSLGLLLWAYVHSQRREDVTYPVG